MTSGRFTSRDSVTVSPAAAAKESAQSPSGRSTGELTLAEVAAAGVVKAT